jgi:hypothetical protein
MCNLDHHAYNTPTTNSARQNPLVRVLHLSRHDRSQRQILHTRWNMCIGWRQVLQCHVCRIHEASWTRKDRRTMCVVVQSTVRFLVEIARLHASPSQALRRHGPVLVGEIQKAMNCVALGKAVDDHGMNQQITQSPAITAKSQLRRGTHVEKRTRTRTSNWSAKFRSTSI